jgi:hypothetical protein
LLRPGIWLFSSGRHATRALVIGDDESIETLGLPTTSLQRGAAITIEGGGCLGLPNDAAKESPVPNISSIDRSGTIAAPAADF